MPAPIIVYVVNEPEPAVFLQSGEAHIRDSVATFLAMTSRGWASRHLLARFDLNTRQPGNRLINTGRFCINGQTGGQIE